jgi:hypothetical protein
MPRPLQPTNNQQTDLALHYILKQQLQSFLRQNLTELFREQTFALDHLPGGRHAFVS